jgi:ribosomal protein L34
MASHGYSWRAQSTHGFKTRERTVSYENTVASRADSGRLDLVVVCVRKPVLRVASSSRHGKYSQNVW